MKTTRLVFLIAFVLIDVVFQIGTTALAVTIQAVPVGNPGNPADTRYYANGRGSVAYYYHLGKYEVTNSQYVAFLNGVDPTGANSLALYNSNMTSDSRGGIVYNGVAADGLKYGVKFGRVNNPVVYVSWYDSIRFTNWMHNGQGSGDTENGAYLLLGGAPTPSNGNSITRNPGATWWLPSEDEWYKAAHHRNDGVTGNYWDFPTSTDSVPYSDQPPGDDAPDKSNTANVFADDLITNGHTAGFAVTGSPSFNNSQNYLTSVGAYSLSKSPYGTFDQGGNVSEWNEALFSGIARGLRGGSWDFGPYGGHASGQGGVHPSDENFNIGFRVAHIPEPSSLSLMALGLMRWWWRRSR